LDDTIKCVVQGEELFEDCQIEHQILDCVFWDIKKKMLCLRKKRLFKFKQGKWSVEGGFHFGLNPYYIQVHEQNL
jgi:hypothetical protein